MAKAKRLNRSSEIFVQLRKRILRWEYPPNYRLTEEALCQEFGVSRVPVREALHMLEEDNLIDKIPHQGCRVRLPSVSEIEELYDVRMALELFIVEQLAKQGMDEETWTELHDTWQSLYETTDPDELEAVDWAQLDEAFHEGLAAATGNQTLLSYLQTLNERLSFVRSTDITNMDRLLETCQQHLPILDAIRVGDGDAARRAMEINIGFGRANVESAMKDALARAFLNA